MNKSNSDKINWKSGCLSLLVLIALYCIIVFPVIINGRNEEAKKKGTQQTAEQFVSTFEDDLSDEDKEYVNNSLSTGATPYDVNFGNNYMCPNNQCSGIKVTAPRESDIVVIIKRDNLHGKVIAHGYIRAGATYQFDIPDGTYQTLFYYGKGWNPDKDMGDGIKGGFVKDEFYSKDLPQDIYSSILSYVLQLQRDGNFQTRESCRSELF